MCKIDLPIFPLLNSLYFFFNLFLYSTHLLWEFLIKSKHSNYFNMIQTATLHRCPRACGNVHSILGLLSTQSPKRNRWLLSTQSWVLNKFKFWVVIECSISEYFLIHHWVHNIFKFWVSIEHSIAQFFH